MAAIDAYELSGASELVPEVDTALPYEQPDLSVIEGEPTERQHTDLFSGSVRVGSDDVTWTLEVPDEQVYDGVAEFVSGFLAVKKSSRAIRRALAQAGIATLTYSPAREDDKSWLDQAKDPQELHVETLEVIGEDLALRTDIPLSTSNNEKLDLQKKLLIAHSMGGLAVTRYALLTPDEIDRIIGLATCGFGRPTAEDIRSITPCDIIQSLRHEIIPAVRSGNLEPSRKILMDTIDYLFHPRVLFEGLSCVGGDVTADVAKLSKQGVPYHYQAYELDFLVPVDESTAEHVASYEVVPRAGHMFPQKHPERVAESVRAIIKAA